MLGHRGLYIHFPRGHFQHFHQRQRILIGAVRRAEAGHGYAQNSFARQSQHIKSPRRYQQGQRAVQSAGNADNSRLGPRVRQTPRQAVGLRGQNFFTPRGHSFFRRHKRQRVYLSGQGRGAVCGQRKRYHTHVFRPRIIGKSTAQQAFGLQPLYVYFAIY